MDVWQAVSSSNNLSYCYGLQIKCYYTSWSQTFSPQFFLQSLCHGCYLRIFLTWHFLIHHIDESYRIRKKKKVFLFCCILSEMVFIFSLLQCTFLSFFVIDNLIGLLHLFLYDDSSSYKHNVTLLYSTHIWNHFLPSLVLSLEFHGVAFCFLAFVIVLSSYRACCALLPAGYDCHQTCTHILSCLKKTKSKRRIIGGPFSL